MIVARALSAAPSLAAHPVGPDSADWARLAAGDPLGGCFAGPDFARAFAGTFGRRAQVFALGLSCGAGRLRAVLPAMRCRVLRRPGLSPRFDYLRGDAVHLADPARAFVPLRQIAPQVGLEAATLRAHLVAEPGWLDAAWAAVPAALAAQGGWDLAVLPMEAERIAAVAAQARAAGMAALLRPIGRQVQSMESLPPLPAIIARGSTKFAQNIRRAERFAAEAGAVFDRLEGDAVAGAMPALAALAAQSWKAAEAGRAAGQAVVVPYAGAQRRFCEALVARPGGLLPILCRVHQGAELKAACLCLLGAGTLTTYLIFQQDGAGRESYGRLVLHRAFEAGHALGAGRVDLNATGQWSQVYADRSTAVENLLLFRPTLYGRALAALARRRAA